jgi:hypothetical protein
VRGVSTRPVVRPGVESAPSERTITTITTIGAKARDRSERTIPAVVVGLESGCVYAASCVLGRKMIGRTPVVVGTCGNSCACGADDSRFRPATPEEAAGFRDAPRSLAAEARSG